MISTWREIYIKLGNQKNKAEYLETTRFNYLVVFYSKNIPLSWVRSIFMGSKFLSE